MVRQATVLSSEAFVVCDGNASSKPKMWEKCLAQYLYGKIYFSHGIWEVQMLPPLPSGRICWSRHCEYYLPKKERNGNNFVALPCLLLTVTILKKKLKKTEAAPLYNCRLLMLN